jgi:hypothetical protein
MGNLPWPQGLDRNATGPEEIQMRIAEARWVPRGEVRSEYLVFQVCCDNSGSRSPAAVRRVARPKDLKALTSVGGRQVAGRPPRALGIHRDPLQPWNPSGMVPEPSILRTAGTHQVEI